MPVFWVLLCRWSGLSWSDSALPFLTFLTTVDLVILLVTYDQLATVILSWISDRKLSLQNVGSVEEIAELWAYLALSQACLTSRDMLCLQDVEAAFTWSIHEEDWLELKQRQTLSPLKQLFDEFFHHKTASTHLQSGLHPPKLDQNLPPHSQIDIPKELQESVTLPPTMLLHTLWISESKEAKSLQKPSKVLAEKLQSMKGIDTFCSLLASYSSKIASKSNIILSEEVFTFSHIFVGR